MINFYITRFEENRDHQWLLRWPQSYINYKKMLSNGDVKINMTLKNARNGKQMNNMSCEDKVIERHKILGLLNTLYWIL